MKPSPRARGPGALSRGPLFLLWLASLCVVRCDSDHVVDTDGGDSADASSGCGDGVVEGDEICDHGSLNSDTEPGSCRTDCSGCLGNFDPASDCGGCLPGWEGDECDLSYCEGHTCWGSLPTGQVECFDESWERPIDCPGTAGSEDCATVDFCGQDAQYPGPERALEARDIDGDRVVVDALTGLTWQHGTFPASGDDALVDCRALVYAGQTDWRLPSYEEGATLLRHAGDHFRYDTNVFPTPTSHIWLSNSAGGLQQWMLRFTEEQHLLDWEQSQMPHVARCVRGPQRRTPEAPDRFTIGRKSSLNPVVTDAATGLVWASQPQAPGPVSWREALSLCEGLVDGELRDWRLPDVHELVSLVDVTRDLPATNSPGAFPEEKVWSSTTVNDQTDWAWTMSFDFGGVDARDKTWGAQVLCVHD